MAIRKNKYSVAKVINKKNQIVGYLSNHNKRRVWLKKMNNDYNKTYTYLLNNEIATEAEIELVTSINGDTLEQLNNILYSKTGYRNIEQLAN